MSPEQFAQSVEATQCILAEWVADDVWMVEAKLQIVEEAVASYTRPDHSFIFLRGFDNGAA